MLASVHLSHITTKNSYLKVPGATLLDKAGSEGVTPGFPLVLACTSPVDAVVLKHVKKCIIYNIEQSMKTVSGCK
jgi:hypothetical protein